MSCDYHVTVMWWASLSHGALPHSSVSLWIHHKLLTLSGEIYPSVEEALLVWWLPLHLHHQPLPQLTDHLSWQACQMPHTADRSKHLQQQLVHHSARSYACEPNSGAEAWSVSLTTHESARGKPCNEYIHAVWWYTYNKLYGIFGRPECSSDRMLSTALAEWVKVCG